MKFTRAARGVPEESMVQAQQLQGKPLVLIAQGDRDAQLTLAQLLRAEGYDFLYASTIEACAALFDTSRPDLILLDAELPPSERVHSDSFHLCRKLNERGACVLMVVPDDLELLERAIEVGATDVINKPVQASILRVRIRRLIEAVQTSARLRDTERRWQQAFEQNNAVQLLIDPDTAMIVDANPAAAAFYGYTREEMREMSMFDLVDDYTLEDAPAFRTVHGFRHRTASGELRDVKLFSSTIDLDGRSYVYQIVQDQTKRRQAEDEIQEQRALLNALRQTSAALVTASGQDDMLDRIFEHIKNVLPHERINIKLIENDTARIVRSHGYPQFNRPEDLENVRLPVNETPNLRWMIETGRPHVVPDTSRYPEWLNAEGWSWVRSHVSAPIRVEGGVIGFLSLDSAQPNQYSAIDGERLQVLADQAAIAIHNARLYDRVRRQAAELEARVHERTAELMSEREQLRATLDAMTEGVAYLMVDREARFSIVYINQALTHISGYSVEVWRERSLNLLRAYDQTEEEFRRMLREAYDLMARGQVWRGELRPTRPDGTEFDASVILAGIHDADRALIGAVTVVRDISQEKALEAQKSRFVAHASHELRTPITNLKTRLYLLRKQPDRMDDHLTVMEEVTDRMRRLVDDLLDISRFERGLIHLQRRECVLQEIIAGALDVQEPEGERKGLKMRREFAPDPILVYADPQRLTQVITNLVTNAINYTPAGGSVTVRVSLVQVDEAVSGYALVEVVDTGIGISSEHLPHIFQPFYRVVSQVSGTGLGLSITREIIELHGGEITVDSQIGKGSTFSFWLPIVTVPQHAPALESDGE